MATVKAHWLIIAVEVIVVCAVTYALLALARTYFGREGLWVLALAGLLCAFLGLWRLRK
jgi:hypothetical protein